MGKTNNNALLRATLVKYMDIYGMSKEQLAMALCMSRQTFASRLNDPRTFSVGELQVAMKRLRIPADEMVQSLQPEGK